jgi:hypothetical protein
MLQIEPVPTENSIALQKREPHLDRERVPRSQKTLVEPRVVRTRRIGSRIRG